MPKFTWLHISDIHFHGGRDGPEAQYMFDKFLKHVAAQRSIGFVPDAIFVTGDMAFGRTSSTGLGSLGDQFSKIGVRLDQLRRVVRGQKDLPKSRVFTIPGNHDVDGTLATLNHRALVEALRSGDISAEFDNRINEIFDINGDPSSLATATRPLSAYREFVKTSGFGPSKVDIERLIYVSELRQLGVTVFGLNSAWACNSKSSEVSDLVCGYGWQSKYLLNLPRAQNLLRILLMHHPPRWFIGQEQREVEKDLTGQFDICLFGHEHDAWVDVRENHVRITAGAIYDRDGGLKAHGYNWGTLDTDAGHGSINLFQYNSSGGGEWVPDLSSATPAGKRDFKLRSGLSKSTVSSSRPPRAPLLTTSVKAMETNAESKHPELESTPRPEILDRSVGAAVVVVCNIAGFSDIEPTRQSEVVRCLWNIVRNAEVVRLQKSHSVSLVPIVDGALIAFFSAPQFPAPNDVLQFSKQVSTRFSQESAPAKLKIAIHCGTASRWTEPDVGELVHGTVVNQAHRISVYADGGQVLCSEDAIGLFKEAGYDLDSFVPSPKAKDGKGSPWPVALFGRKPLGVRLYREASEVHVPHVVTVLDAVKRAIDLALDQLQRKFLKLMLDRNLIIDDVVIGQLRASILEPIHKTLHPTGFRRELKRQKKGGKKHWHFDDQTPGESCYSLDGDGVGPAGRAYKAGRPIAVNTDADWDSKRTNYLAAFAQTGLGEESLRNWRRKSKMVLAIPLGIFAFHDTPPDAVICIDSDGPVLMKRKGRRGEPLPAKDLARIGEEMMGQELQFMAWIWRVRSHP